MIPLTAEEAAAALGGERFPCVVRSVSIDTRTLRTGDVFVALRGERFDGHNFVLQALAAGAAAVVVEDAWWGLPGTATGEKGGRAQVPPAMQARVCAIPDTLAGLGRLARAVRRKSGAKVIAVTGSVGKTSTKDLITAMARRVANVVSTVANQNNEVGVPLTLLSIGSDVEVVVVEMGMRGPGQIAALAQVAEPDVGVITNVHPVHLGLLGSMEHIAKAKAELITSLGEACTAVVPADCALMACHVKTLRCGILRFALGPGSEDADVWGAVIGHSGTNAARLYARWPHAEGEVEVPFMSRHRLENTIAALAACHGTGLATAACLQGAKDTVFTPARGDMMEVGGWLVVNDTYNANPVAVRTALDDLVDLAGQRGRRLVAVLGDMLELGPDAEHFHEECGAYAAEVGVRVLWGVGRWSRATTRGFLLTAKAGQTAGHVETVEDVGPVFASLLPGDVVLFKASHSVGLEKMVAALMETARRGRGSVAQDDHGRGDRL
jgi:UDP-N-acetylmuramoyl-tripeptide--D-alanyl-D-alanine ligase